MSAEAVVRNPLKFTGNGFEIALLMLKNAVLTVLTLGIYRPWAVTNMRRYLWGNTVFMEDRAAYTGTGGELFRGWLKLIGLLIALMIAAKLLTLIVPLAGILVFFVYMLIIALAIYSGLRYRLSRTLWRQIRFGVDKNEKLTKEFLRLYLISTLKVFLTLGIYTPWFRNDIRKFLTDRSRFGNSYFHYDGDGSEYAGVVYKGLLLSVCTLWIYSPWWVCDLVRYRWTHTSFQGKRFAFDLKGGEVFVFFLVAFIGTVITFGLATPWIYAWGLRMLYENTYLEGTPDFNLVQAQASDGSAMADDIVIGYDLDFGL